MRSHRTTVLLLLFAFSIAAMPLLSQSPTGQRLSFEVASIKPHKLGGPLQSKFDPRSRHGTDDNNTDIPLSRCILLNISLKSLVAAAFQERLERLSGGPDWIDHTTFDIETKAEHPVTNAELHLMLQALLVDRFHLLFHRENREVSVYALVVAKNGPNLTRAASDEKTSSSWSQVGPNTMRLTIKNWSLSALASRLEVGQPIRPLPSLGRPVLDKTGIRGGFDFTLDLEWTLDANGKRDPTGYPICEAIQEQLGLKLESQKAPMEFFVIDHAEQPTANRYADKDIPLVISLLCILIASSPLRFAP